MQSPKTLENGEYKMNRMVKILAAVSMSSVYVMQIPCTSFGNGLTIIPNVPSLRSILPWWPF
jgi:hypothetical protein